jgi:hypothetical protein
MNSIKTSFLALLILLLASCLTTPEKKPVIQGPFDSHLSDTINRLSGKMPSIAGTGGLKDASAKSKKAIHVRRNFQHYGSKRVARRDIAAEKSEVLDLCCSNPKIQKAIENGVTLHFDYYGKNGLYVASTMVDQNTCEQQALTKAYGEVKKRDGVYIVYASGIVKDTQNNLEWMAGPDRNVTWYEADNWVKNLKTAGGRWRMPTT